MAFGYAARYLSAQSPIDIKLYILQTLFIILPPSLYAATIYMVYGRLVIFVNAEHASIIRPTRVALIFVCGNVVAFLLQASGGGMMVLPSKADMGQNIMLVGLYVQILFFVVFAVISIVFYARMRRSPQRHTIPHHGESGWQALYKLLAIAAFVIIIRCVYRVIEFTQGHGGDLASHEIYIYIFDTLPMFVVQVLFHFVRADDVFGTNHGAEKKLDSEIGLPVSEIIGLSERA